jgi:hypothetical protein
MFHDKCKSHADWKQLPRPIKPSSPLKQLKKMNAGASVTDASKRLTPSLLQSRQSCAKQQRLPLQAPKPKPKPMRPCRQVVYLAAAAALLHCVCTFVVVASGQQVALESSWSTANLGVARFALAATSLPNLAIFAGGCTSFSNLMFFPGAPWLRTAVLSDGVACVEWVKFVAFGLCLFLIMLSQYSQLMAQAHPKPWIFSM